jgi:transcriptional regulator with XRE-family HTH domain
MRAGGRRGGAPLGPAEWSHDDVRELRVATGLSQSRFGAALRALGKDLDGSEPQTDRGTVSRWERGIERPSLYYRRLLSELDRRLEAESVAELRRRDVLRLGGAVSGLTAVAPMLESWDRLVLALQGSGTVDDDVVANLEAQTAGFHELERQLPGRALFPKLEAHLDGLADVLRGQMSSAQRRRLIRVAGDAAVLAGWITWDMRSRVAAMRLYKTASVAAHEADDPALLACTLAYRSYAIGVDGDHRTAVGMLAKAVRHAEAAGYTKAVAWLRARQAEELSSLGDTSALDEIEKAMTAFDLVGEHERRGLASSIERGSPDMPRRCTCDCIKHDVPRTRSR